MGKNRNALGLHVFQQYLTSKRANQWVKWSSLPFETWNTSLFCDIKMNLMNTYDGAISSAKPHQPKWIMGVSLLLLVLQENSERL